MSKKTYGIQPKMRTIEEINQNYNNEAAQFGHKTRILSQIECELETHLERMKELTKEASLVQKKTESSQEKPEQESEVKEETPVPGESI